MGMIIEQNNELINKYKINPLIEINEPPTYCLINNRPSLTAGNFSLIYGKKKAGKTFLLGGIIASTINNSTQLEAIKGCLPKDKNVILYFDTEQSQYHASRSIKRICSLISNPNPNNLSAYNLRPLMPKERLAVIESIITMTPNVGIVAIDGIRDLLTRGINDEQEATELTSLFLKWSYNLNIHIVLLLHQNKGDEHARGHIGSEVVNKAETTISVTKDDKNNVFKVVCEDSRDIPFDDFNFTINEDGLPIAADIKDYKPKRISDPKFIRSEEHLSILKELFKTGIDINYTQLTKALSEDFGVGVNIGKKFVAYYKDKGWLTTERNGMSVNYKLNPDAQSFYWN
jgi:RecA-family ATPase